MGKMTTVKRGRKFGLYAGAVLPLSLGAAGIFGVAAANASTSTSVGSTKTTISLPQAIQNAQAAATKRQTVLQSLSSKVAASTTLTSSDAAALTTVINATLSGINTIAAEIPGSQSLSQVHGYVKSMIQEYRVFLVVQPQVGLTMGLNRAASVAAKAAGVETKMQNVISKLQAKGDDVAQLQGYLSTFTSDANSASTAISGQTSIVLAQTPSGYNSNSAGVKGIFTTAKGDLATARTDRSGAHSAWMSFVSEARSLRGSSHSLNAQASSTAFA